ncbi:hypothetical protein CW683_01325 [Macrococcoides caseolyticum]|nr:hypothetical protein CW683_01325 [Macrococcus caseolyticus]
MRCQMINSEIWKDIPGFEGLYQVSNKGRVRSYDRYTRIKCDSKRLLKGRVMALSNTSTGYKKIALVDKSGKKKEYKVHRLVLLAFVGKSDLEVNHKDFNPINNELSNLEYCTSKENINHSYEYGERISARKFKKQIIEDYKNGLSSTEVAKKYGACWKTVNKYLLEEGINKRPNRLYKPHIKTETILKLKQDGLTHKEISKRLDISLATIKRRLKIYRESKVVS